MSKAWGGRNLIGFSFLLASTALLAFTSAAAFAEPVRESPTVSSIAIVSSPASGGTYELGEIIEVAVEFDIAVTATGSPQIVVTIGTHTRHATFSRLDGQSLYFSYDVHEEDLDEDGISIAANALILDGGTITADDGTVDADLTHAAVAAQGGSKVNGSLVSPPAVKGISWVSSPARGDTHERGETIELIVQFDRVVTATGGARLALTIGTETRHATAYGWGSGTSLYFSYTVQDGDRDEDGISIAANSLALAGGTIKGPDGTTDADLTHEAVAAEAGRKVDGSLVSPAAVKSINLMSSRAGDGTYELGEAVQVWVEFDRAVTVTGSPQVALTIGAETRYAVYYSSFDRHAHFSYPVQEGDRDDDGVSIAANSLLLNGGTITARDGTTDAVLAHDAVAPAPDRKVDGNRDVAPPRVRDIYLDSSPARGDTYQLGETIEVEVEFDRAIEATGEPQIALTIGTRTRRATRYGWSSHSLRFQYTVQAGDRDEDGISIPANALSLVGGTITAADGTTAADLTHEAVAPEGASKVNGSDVTPPQVRAIRFGYSPPARGDTYELGETVEVEVEFDRAVTATGAPRVALTVGTETRHAAFRGWGTQSLHFDYTVQAGDRDEDGISIPANALALAGGSITAADGTTAADLTHGTVTADGDRKVNGSLASPPGVTHLYFGDSPARGNTYERGETVRVGVHFDKVVKVTGRPQVELTIGAETRYATLSTRWGDDRYVDFSYVVQEGDRDEDGISIPANALILNGGSITAADGTTDADLTHAAVGPERDRKVDGSGDVTPARVAAIYFDSSPARGDTYELGETVEVVVTFDGGVEATGEPRVALTIGTQTRHATFSGWGSNSLYFSYTVQEGDRDEDGISIPANTLLSGGTITAPDGTTPADLTHAAVAADGGSKVNGSLVAPPRVRDMSFDYLGRSHTYARGETIEVKVEFNRTVTVTGTPRLALTIGAKTRHAVYSRSWREYADFRYVVQEDDRDDDGISIPANALELNGGTITAADGTTDADLTHAPVGPDPDRKVDGSSAVTPPRVRAIYYDSSPPRSDTYELGETVEVVVEFDGGVEATGNPQIALTIGTETRYANFSGWSSDNTLRFRYTVQTGDSDEDGISIPANSLLRGGGSITARDGITEAVLTHAAIAAEPGPRVNGNAVTPPAVRGIYLISSPARGDTYERGETVEVVVDFDRAVTEIGNPQLALTIGREIRHATSAGWGSDSLFFSYTVQAGDRDDDGISVAANSLLLGGGAITATDGTTDADLRHDAMSARGGSKVNGSLISPPGVSGIFFVSAPNQGDTYTQGETIEVLVEFDRAMTVTGNPQVALTIGAQTRYATYSTAWEGDRLMHFSYAVQEDDRDENGVTITANALALNSGTIKHAADLTVDADLTHGAVAAEPAFKVNGSPGTP